jgi:hypothetical protein
LATAIKLVSLTKREYLHLAPMTEIAIFKGREDLVLETSKEQVWQISLILTILDQENIRKFLITTTVYPTHSDLNMKILFKGIRT